MRAFARTPWRWWPFSTPQGAHNGACRGTSTNPSAIGTALPSTPSNTASWASALTATTCAACCLPHCGNSQPSTSYAWPTTNSADHYPTASPNCTTWNTSSSTTTNSPDSYPLPSANSPGSKYYPSTKITSEAPYPPPWACSTDSKCSSSTTTNSTIPYLPRSPSSRNCASSTYPTTSYRAPCLFIGRTPPPSDRCSSHPTDSQALFPPSWLTSPSSPTSTSTTTISAVPSLRSLPHSSSPYTSKTITSSIFPT